MDQPRAMGETTPRSFSCGRLVLDPWIRRLVHVDGDLGTVFLCVGYPREKKLEFLLMDTRAPLINSMFDYQTKPTAFIEFSRRMQSLESPEEYPFVARFPAKANGFLYQCGTYSQAVKIWIYDEPAQSCAFGLGVASIYAYASGKSAFV